MERATQRVAIYARLSVSTEESVSIARQLEAGRRLAELRGWTVVLEASDDGVSATRSRPEDRPGWQSVLESCGAIDAVVVWKIDRLARRVLDFLHTVEVLSSRGTNIVAVEDPIDMTTPQGRGFATMLAVFAEMEAAAISSRVRASRDTLQRAGRRTGGRPPFGWMNRRNDPPEPGFVLEQDPDRIDIVRALTDRALAGHSLYSLTKWLDDTGVQTRARRTAGGGIDSEPQHARWHDASVEAILRSPVLGGMTPERGDVLRGDDGLPIVNRDIAIMTPAEWRQLQAVLDGAKRPGTRLRAGTEPALLYGIVRCGSCGGLMYRATAASKYKQYRCQQKGCPRPVGITRPGLEEHVVARTLEERGGDLGINVVAGEREPDRAALEDIEAEIRLTTNLMTVAGADLPALIERLHAQHQAREEAQSQVVSEPTYVVSPVVLREEWARTDGVEERRQLLLEHIEAVRVSGTGRRGRGFDTSRVEIVWRDMPEEARVRRDQQLAALERMGFKSGAADR